MPLLDLFFSMMWLFLWIAWIWLVISVFIDIFRSHDLGGFAKAFWALFVLLVPFLGVFIYLIARGDKMQDRAAREASERDDATKQYIRNAAGTGNGGTAGELEKLVNLRDSGVLTADEFAAQKAKLLG